MNMHISYATPVRPVWPAVVATTEPGTEYVGELAAQEEISRHFELLRGSKERLGGVTKKLVKSMGEKPVPLTDIDGIEEVVDEAAKNVLRAKNAMEEMLEAQGDQPALTPTEQEFFDMIKAMLDGLDAKYLAYFDSAINQFTQYFDEIRQALNRITAKTDADHPDKVYFNDGSNHNGLGDGAKKRLQAIIDKPWSIGSFGSEAEARKIGDSLAPAFKVVQVGDKWEVRIDTAQAQTLLNTMPQNSVWITNAEYNTWTTKRESAVASLNTAAQATAESFSRATSTYDNIIKLLSSLIESMMKMMEGFLPT